jgi:hypothetical protein
MTDLENPVRSAGQKCVSDKIKQELKVYECITQIFEKIDRDGSLDSIQASIFAIIDSEILFAMTELLKMGSKNRKLNIKNQLTNNTYIFKENLKTICSILSRLIS